MRDSFPDLDPLSKNLGVPLNRVILHSVDLAQAASTSETPEGTVHILAELSAEPVDIDGEELAVSNILNELIAGTREVLPQGGSVTLKTCVADSTAYLDLTFVGPTLDFDYLDRSIRSIPFLTQSGECIRDNNSIAAVPEGLHQKSCTIRLTFAVSKTLGAPSPALPASKAEHILLIDDDPILLHVVRQILASDGHHVVVASGGKQGVDVFAEALNTATPFGIVITDFNMPDLDGEEVAKAIKKAMGTVPVVLLTASGYGVEQGNQSPYFDVVLSKPTKASEIRSAIAQCRRRKEAA
jgi:CheY-like chemotaxis protein